MPLRKCPGVNLTLYCTVPELLSAAHVPFRCLDCSVATEGMDLFGPPQAPFCAKLRGVEVSTVFVFQTFQ